MARNISFTVKYWKQDGPTAQGHFDTHEMKNGMRRIHNASAI